VPVEQFSHLQYSAVPSVEWQQQGQKHGRSFARFTIEEQRGIVWFVWAEGVKPVEIRHPKEGMPWIFSPEKYDGFGRVQTHNLGYQRTACLPGLWFLPKLSQGLNNN
jgi:phenylpropionate dioxygenase-like ring-hydroxylating dioxygenase large terminal subunit